MNYKLQITKVLKNENYAEEVKQWQKVLKANMYFRSETTRPEPITEVVQDVLLVELTDEQFEAVKAAVLKEFV